MIVTFPFLYPVHAAPCDYLRYTRFYIENLAEETGFAVLESSELSGFWYSTGVNAGLYLQSWDKFFLKLLCLVKLLISAVQLICSMLHLGEKLILECLGVDPAGIRSAWPVNYVFVLRKLPQ
jgi:hypothetical protein